MKARNLHQRNQFKVDENKGNTTLAQEKGPSKMEATMNRLLKSSKGP